MVTSSSGVSTKQSLSYRRGLLVLAVLGIGLYLIVPQFSGLHDSWHAIGQANITWLFVAGGCLLATYVVAALIYLLLAKKRLRYGRTVLLQVASMFAGRVLPAGVGALGLNYLYLRRHGHKPVQAGAVVTTNNVLGFLGNILLLAGLLVTTDATFPAWHPTHIVIWVVGGLAVLGVVLLVGYKTRLRRQLVTNIREVLGVIASYRRQPWRLLAALCCSIVLTALYAALLYACIQAIGLHLSYATAMVVMSLGVAGATATPTPGGLGGAEAALAGGLVLYDVRASEAVAVALLYRLFTYWLGLLLGAVALVIAKHRHYI